MTSLTRPPDEFANCLTHAVGFVLSVAATGYLMTRVTASISATKRLASLFRNALITSNTASLKPPTLRIEDALGGGERQRCGSCHQG